MAAPSTFIRTYGTGYAHPGCCLSFTNGCSTRAADAPWFARPLKEELPLRSDSSLSWHLGSSSHRLTVVEPATGLLCHLHHSALAALDEHALAVLDAFKPAFESSNVQAQRRCSLEGPALERWVLKLIVAFLYSPGSTNSCTPAGMAARCLELLCTPHSRWPPGWGLHVDSIRRKARVDRQLLAACPPRVTMAVGELRLHLVLGKTTPRNLLGAFHPGALELVGASCDTNVRLNWRSQRPSTRVIRARIEAWALNSTTPPAHPRALGATRERRAQAVVGNSLAVEVTSTCCRGVDT